jgi:hypothetical protein
MFETVVFYVFAGILLLAALRVITARNPVHAALYLVLAFFTAAGIWLLLRAEFLAIVLVLVYVGAVMVLFLFVVMMLDVNLERLREGFWKNLPLAVVVGGRHGAGDGGGARPALFRCRDAHARRAARLQQHRELGRCCTPSTSTPSRSRR